MKDSKRTTSIVKVKDNTNVVQANALLENRPKFTKDETRLFLTILGTINKDDDDFAIIEIPVMEFAEMWEIDSAASYRKIKAALRGLRSKEFFLEGTNPETGKKRFLSMSYLSMVSYEEGEGYARVRIDPDFKPYLLDLKKNYTLYMMENVLNLTTVNAIRNYELLKQYENLGERIFNIDDYKKKLGIEDKYSLNGDIKRFVIEPSIEEINNKTDIEVDYEFQGRGKKAKIIFDIKSKKKNIIEDSEYEVIKEEVVEDFKGHKHEHLMVRIKDINKNWELNDAQADLINDQIYTDLVLPKVDMSMSLADIVLIKTEQIEKVLKIAAAGGAKNLYAWLTTPAVWESIVNKLR